MSIQGKLAAEPRTALGSNQSRQLRKSGLIPGNLYGHKEVPVAFSVAEDVLAHLIKTGIRIVDLSLEGKSVTTLLREVQWDHLGSNIQHVDLLRVDPNEKLTVEVHVELKGTAPGMLSGGILDHSLRTLTIECPVGQIPETIVVKVGSLEVGQAVHVKELEIPPGSRVLNNPEAVVVRIAKVVEAAPLTGLEGSPAQPEVIGRKAAEDEKAE